MIAFALRDAVLLRSKWTRSLAAAGLLLFALAGCARNVKLKPLPAAKGGGFDVKVSLTFNRNDQIEVKVHGPDPSEYGPNFTRYVAWVKSPDGSYINNAGQIRMEKGKGDLITVTPLRKFYLFVTVEEKGDVLKPGQIVFETPKLIEW